MNYYVEALDSITHWLHVLNEGEKASPPDVEDLSVYLDEIPLRLAGGDHTLVGHLVDEIGGVWSFRPLKETQ